MSLLQTQLEALSRLSTTEIAQHEPFWTLVRQDYDTQKDFINLENGYYGTMPNVLLEAQINHTKALNKSNTYFMREGKDQVLKNLKAEFGTFLGVNPQSIAFCRNATDGLNILISGIQLNKGDEILACTQDYPTGVEAIIQKSHKEGIKPVMIDIPLHPKDDAEIVECFEKAITSNTKLLVITHIIHWTGQILPVKKIIEMAHKHNIEVLVDSAHALAHIDFNLADLDCDYWVANLHKWLSAPLTAGIIFIKKEKIAQISPLFASVHKPKDDIAKLENVSAVPMAIFMTVFDAIQHHNIFGTPLKQARLQYLQHYWTKKILGMQATHTPNVFLNTPINRACAIANVGIKGMKGTEIAKILFEKYHIHTVGFDLPFMQGVRITPQFYNELADLDKLVDAIKKIAKANLHKAN